jgi:hypothetical protein
MPKLDASKNARKKTKFKTFKRKLYHDVWYKLLKPVRQAQQKGGFMLYGKAGEPMTRFLAHNFHAIALTMYAASNYFTP